LLKYGGYFYYTTTHFSRQQNFHKKWAKQLTPVKRSTLFTVSKFGRHSRLQPRVQNGYGATSLARGTIKILLMAAAGGLRYGSPDGGSTWLEIRIRRLGRKLPRSVESRREYKR
jgi:hypothetical protein